MLSIMVGCITHTCGCVGSGAFDCASISKESTEASKDVPNLVN